MLTLSPTPIRSLAALLEPAVLKQAGGALGPALGPELSKLLAHHWDELEMADGDAAYEPVALSTMAIVRFLRKAGPDSPELAALRAAGSGKMSPALEGTLRTLQQLVLSTRKRLSTTVEEDQSRRERYAEVSQRVDKALKERQSLEQQLRIEKRERSRTVAHTSDAEGRAKVRASTSPFSRDPSFRFIRLPPAQVKRMLTPTHVNHPLLRRSLRA